MNAVATTKDGFFKSLFNTETQTPGRRIMFFLIVLFAAAFIVTAYFTGSGENVSPKMMEIPTNPGETGVYYEEMPDIMRVSGNAMGYENFFVEPSQEGTKIILTLTNRNIPNPNMRNMDMVIFKTITVDVSAKSALTGEFTNHNILIMNEPFAIHSQGGIGISKDIEHELFANGYTDNYKIVRVSIN